MDDKSISELLNQIDRLDQQATSGPWVANDRGIGYEITTQQQIDEATEVKGWPMPINSGIKDTFPRSDAEFIALARTFAPAAAKALRTILTECESFEVAHDDEDNPFHQGVHWTVMAIRQAITDAMEGDNA